MPITCPSCGQVNRDDALMCSLCQALFRKVPPKLPPSVTGHAAWPRIQEHLDAARAAVKTDKWEDARFVMDEALGLLPDPAAKALVVGLGRQWIAALRVDPATRARLNATLDRFRAALDESRFADAAAEIKAATELTKDQVSDVMPIVGIGMRVLANRAATASAQTREPRETSPASATPAAGPQIREGAEFTALAEEVVAQKDGPFFQGFGFLPDFSPASLVVLDAFMDSMWGTSGAAPNDESWSPPPGKQRMIAQFGSYLGETLRRQWTGQWKRDERGPMWTMVALPQDLSCVPFGKVYRRMKNGREDSLYGLYQAVRQELGPPAGERESYAEHAERLRTHRGPLEAAEAASNLEALAEGRDPFGITEHTPGDTSHVGPADQPQPDLGIAEAALGSMPAFSGIPLDGSLGSLIAIDGVLDELWGSADDTTSVDRTQAESLVEPLAAYVGEVAIRHVGGTWVKGEEDAWLVRLSDGTAIEPASFVKQRLNAGASHDLWRQLGRSHSLDEGAWAAIGDHGTACHTQGRTAIARRIFTHMTSSGQPRVEAQGHYFLSVCARMERRFDEMLPELDRALALVPDVPAWVENRGVALLELNRVADATESWRRALAVGHGLGDEARARLHRRIWDADHPERPAQPEAAGPFRQEAFRLAGLRRYADALVQLDRALELDPVDAESWQNKGAALAALFRPADAVDALRKAVEYDAPPPDAMQGLARLLVGLSRWSEALPVLDRLIEIDPQSPEYSALKAQCVEKLAGAP